MLTIKCSKKKAREIILKFVEDAAINDPWIEDDFGEDLISSYTEKYNDLYGTFTIGCGYIFADLHYDYKNELLKLKFRFEREDDIEYEDLEETLKFADKFFDYYDADYGKEENSESEHRETQYTLNPEIEKVEVPEFARKHEISDNEYRVTIGDYSDDMEYSNHSKPETIRDYMGCGCFECRC